MTETVYVVREWDYDESNVLGLFETEAAAKAAVEAFHRQRNPTVPISGWRLIGPGTQIAALYLRADNGTEFDAGLSVEPVPFGSLWDRGDPNA